MGIKLDTGAITEMIKSDPQPTTEPVDLPSQNMNRESLTAPSNDLVSQMTNMVQERTQQMSEIMNFNNGMKSFFANPFR